MGFSKKRVVITGVGVIAPNGNDKKTFWENLKKGRSAIGKITRFDTSGYSTQIAGEVKDFHPEKYIEFKKAKRMGRFSQFAFAAAKMAVTDSMIEISKEDPEKIAVIIGMAVQGVDIIEEVHSTIKERGPQFVNPFSIAQYSPNAAVGHICIEFGIKGRSMIITTGCSSASNAIGNSFEKIQNGACDIIITGGVETPITSVFLGSFCAMKSLSQRNDDPLKASRPFDKNRDGYVLSEGSAIFILEELDHAMKRNAPIYAEVIGYSSTSDTYSMYKVNPSEEQVARTMYEALKSADIKYKEVNYINAHASSSLVSDIRESRAIKMTFNGYSKKIPVSSLKSMIGHPLGAAGAIQCAATVMSMQENVVHPTINYEEPDSACCDLDYVPNEARQHNVDIALVNSFGIGGNNASLILKKYK